MSSTLFTALKTKGTLPSPAGVALQIIRVADDPEASADRLAAVVGRDPATAGRLLKYANSPLAGRCRQVASLSKAIALLGVQTVKNIALGLSILNQKPEHCRAFDANAFASDSLARAAAIRHVLQRLKSFAPDEGFTCGLLSQVGRLGLAFCFPAEYGELLTRAARERSASLLDLERQAFQIDHDELTAEMMADWHLPNVFCDAARFQETPDQDTLPRHPRSQTLSRLINFAGIAASVLASHVVRRERLAALVLSASRLGIQPDVTAEVFDAIAWEWRQMGEVFHVKTRPARALAEFYTAAIPDKPRPIPAHAR